VGLARVVEVVAAMGYRGYDPRPHGRGGRSEPDFRGIGERSRDPSAVGLGGYDPRGPHPREAVEDPVVSLSGMTQVLSLAVTGFQTLILTQVVMTVVVVLGAVLRIEDLGGTC
jgi:hypothetical protein